MGYSYSGYGGGGDPTGGDSSNSAPLGSAAYFENQLKTMADLAAQKKAAYQKILDQQKAYQNEDAQNWMPTAIQGAQTGSAFNKGWGTLIGGIIGTGIGMINANKNQMANGVPWWKAMLKTAFDPTQTFGSTRQLNRDFGAAAPAAANIGGAFQQSQAKQKAADINATPTPSSDMLSGSSNPESLDSINAWRAQRGLPPLGQDPNTINGSRTYGV